MTVATPLSLTNIKSEFGNTIGYIYVNGEYGTITAPVGATGLKITLRGGGGGGDDGYTGGNGGLLIKNVSVTGGVTSVYYETGFGGYFGPGGNATVIVNSVTYIAYGGQQASGGNGANGGTSGNGDTNTTGGGNAGGDAFYGSQGAYSTVVIEWLYNQSKLSQYTRGNGFIPNHSQNSNIPTTTPGLGIGDFNDAALNFTATFTVDAADGTGYQAGLYGTISRDQVGLSRFNLTTSTLQAIYQTRGTFYDLLGNPIGYAYSTYVKFSGDLTSLGYTPFVAVYVNGLGVSISNIFTTVTFDGYSTIYANGFSYLGGFDEEWLFNVGTNTVELVYNTAIRYDTIASQTITSGSYSYPGAAPLQAPIGADAVTIKMWGGGAGGAGGQGGGGGGYAEITNAPINSQETFYYTVGSGGGPGADGVGSSVSSAVDGAPIPETEIFFSNASIGTGGGYANGAGGVGAIPDALSNFIFPNRWYDYSFGEVGESSVSSNGGNAGGISYGGGAGGIGAAGTVPGGGGASGYSGARGEIRIEWKVSVPVPYTYTSGSW